MSALSEHVTIIGCGLCGPFLAIALQKHGIKSTIYERHPEGIVGGTMGLTSNALRCLDHIGLYEELRPLGVPVDGFPLMNLKGDIIKTFILGSEEKYGYSALRIRRNLLRQTLLKAIARLGIEIKYEMKCSSIEENADSTTVHFVSGESIITKGLVIGADGLNSRVRESIAPGKHPKYDGQWAIFGFAKKESLKHALNASSSMRLIIGSGGAFGIIPAANDEVWFFNTAEAVDRSKAEWKALEADKEQLKEILKHPFAEEPWPDVVRELATVAPAENYFCWPFQSVPDIESWSSSQGKLVVLGDAAHAIPPTAGQGTAMAFEDALTLSNTISTIRKKTAESPTSNARELLLKWESARKARIERVADRTKRAGNARKGSANEDSQRDKEQKLKAEDDVDEVNWLYSYDAGAFDVEKN